MLPSLDLWLHVENDEIHYVSHLLPTLDWEGGLLGVRLRLEPKNVDELYKEFSFGNSEGQSNPPGCTARPNSSLTCIGTLA